MRGAPSPMALLMNPAMALSSAALPPRQNSGAAFQSGQMDPRLYHPTPPTDASVVVATTGSRGVSARRNSSPATRERSSYAVERVSSPSRNWAESEPETQFTTSDISSRLYQAHPQGPDMVERAQRLYEISRNGNGSPVPEGNSASPPPSVARNNSTIARQRERELHSPLSPSRSVHMPLSPSASSELYHAAMQYSKFKRLRPGEVVYWHHLSRRGELPGVCDDDRARASRGFGPRRRSALATTDEDDADSDVQGKVQEADEWEAMSGRSTHALGRRYRGMVTSTRMWCAR